jgi:hypothetical protein
MQKEDDDDDDEGQAHLLCENWPHKRKDEILQWKRIASHYIVYVSTDE